MTSSVGHGGLVFKATEGMIESSEEKTIQEPMNEKKVSKHSLEEKFDSLYTTYFSVLRATEGCGRRAQEHIDAAHEKLTQFASKHPEFESKLPEKATCSSIPVISNDMDLTRLKIERELEISVFHQLYGKYL